MTAAPMIAGSAALSCCRLPLRSRLLPGAPRAADDKLRELTDPHPQVGQKLLDKGSRVYGAFLEMETATFADGALPARTKDCW